MILTELRIGNYLNNGQIHQVQEITSKGVVTGKIYNYSEYSGYFPSTISYINLSTGTYAILLTEEWLLKLGFTQNTDYPFPMYQIGIDKSILNQIVLSVVIRHEHMAMIIREGDPGDGIHEDNGITLWDSQFDGHLHIHELQNIYHSVSKKELIIKEPAV
jgi:hypothetical protein